MTSGIKTDHGTYAEPALPSLPGAGGKFTDPTFGATIMRVTDANDGTHLTTAYSYWPSFNCNVTRLVVMNADGTKLFYTFNPTTFTLGSKSVYSGPLNFNNGSYWHPTNPDLIYTFKSVDTQLYQYNVATQVETVVKDFASDIGAGRYVFQPSMSDDCSVIAFTVRTTADYGVYGYMVYNLVTDKVLLFQVDSTIDEVHVSKTGTHAIAKLYPPQASRLWDLSNTSSSQYLPFYDPTSPLEGLSHSSMEVVDAIGFTATYSSTVSKWSLSNFARTELLNIGWSSTGAAHVSCLADNADWSLIGWSDGNPHVVGPFHNELFLVKHDGSGSVYRFCHHRGVYYEYEDSQFANISRDGKWVAFSSNWGASSAGSRRDVFIVNIPESPASRPTPTPTPPDPVIKKVAWPKQEGKQDQVIAEQWALGFRFKKNLTGDFAEFEKVK